MTPQVVRTVVTRKGFERRGRVSGVMEQSGDEEATFQKQWKSAKCNGVGGVRGLWAADFSCYFVLAARLIQLIDLTDFSSQVRERELD